MVHRRLQFSLSAFLVAVAFISAGLAYLAAMRQWHLSRYHAIAQLRAADGSVYEVPRRKGLLDLFADDEHVFSITEMYLEDLPPQFLSLIGLFPELEVLVLPAELGDVNAAKLKPMYNVHQISCYDSRFTDIGVTAICRAFPNVTDVYLTDAQCSDDAMKAISDLTRLERLQLQGSSISDIGLALLSQNPLLIDLDLARSNVKWHLPERSHPFPSLVALSLTECPLDRTSATHLAELPVTFLDVRCTPLTHAEISMLIAEAHLTTLAISDEFQPFFGEKHNGIDILYRSCDEEQTESR